MAITNAQQYKQLMQNGGRIGLQGGGADMGAEDRAQERADRGYGDTSGPDRSRTSDRQDYNTAIVTGQNPLGIDLSKGPPDLTPKEKEFNRLNNLSFAERFRINSLKNLYDQKFGFKKATPSFLSALNVFNPSLEVYEKSDPNLDDYGMSGEDLTDTDRLADAINTAQDTGNITQSEFENAFFGPDGRPESPKDGDGPSDPCKGPNPPAYCFVGIRSVEPEVKEDDEDEIINYRLMSQGGRAAFAGGGKDAGAGSNFGNENFGGNGDNNREQYGAVGQYKSPPPSSTGGDGPPTNVGGNNQKTPVVVNPIKNLQTHFNNNQKLKDAVALGLITNEEYNTLGGYDAKQTLGMGPIDTGLASLGYNVVQSIKGNQPVDEIFGDVARNVKGATNISPELQDKYEKIMQMADGGRAGLAEGGMPYEGGIMDLESSRQMYGLGKLVKKVTRSVKKIAKSPIGKAALGAALFKFGGGFAADGFFRKTLLPKLYTGGKLTGLGTGILGIGVPAAAAYFMTPEEEEEQKLSAGADIADPSYIMNNPGLFTNRRLAAEGGDIEKEPVAKKVMPLLDMDGKEKDYRETGGFVDMGRMEKADDVPARLSKNEFVFTADAVRNAGDGSVDKGAEVMYNMMKNLESGGDVSEESQGLEGARKMFQTSQRLEEVL